MARRIAASPYGQSMAQSGHPLSRHELQQLRVFDPLLFPFSLEREAPFNTPAARRESSLDLRIAAPWGATACRAK
jgi:hypothetical protein